MRRGHPVLLLVALVGALTVAGCGHEAHGWRRLWPPEWKRVQLGERWEMGMPADGRVVEVRRRALLRADLLNPTPRWARVAIDLGWKHSLETVVAPGAVLPIEVELGRGRHRVTAPPGVMLGSPRLGRPLPEPRLVVLALVDALRADHVNPELTPRLLSAFRAGRRFVDVTADAPWTLPSVASLFTARPVLDLTTPEGELIGVPQGLATWPQALDAAGFLGAAVVANYTVHARNGFAEGFATYLVPDAHGAPGPDASWVVAEARAFLAAHAGEDVFLYLHLMDTHEPYRDHTAAGRVTPELAPLAHRRRHATADEAALLRELYAGDVRHVDRELAPFLGSLPAGAVVALTADHGESLGEHGCWGHGLSLYQPELAVPLLLRGPGVTGGVEQRPVRLLDLGPTLLALAGVAPGETLLGRSLLAGGSDLPAVSATFGAGPLRWAVREGRAKVLLHLASQPGLGARSRTTMEEGEPLPSGVFVFDLDQDPGEERPQPLDGRLLTTAGQAFVATAGRLVPGLQIIAWGERGPTGLEVELAGRLDVVQAWSASRVTCDQRGGVLRLHCAEAFPVCAVAGPLVGPGGLRPRAGATPWQGLEPGREVPLSSLAPPTTLTAGRIGLWLNPPRERVVSAYQETLERLKALGYLH